MVDWNKFENNNFLEIKEGEPKKLVLTEWKDAESKFPDGVKPAVEFTVLEEDGKLCAPIKTWRISNYTAIQKLRPIVEEAEMKGQSVIHVTITRVGQNKATQYAVAKFSPLTL